MAIEPLRETVFSSMSALELAQYLHRHATCIGKAYLEIARRRGDPWMDIPQIYEWANRIIAHNRATAQNRPVGCCDNVPTIEQIAELIERNTRRPRTP